MDLNLPNLNLNLTLPHLVVLVLGLVLLFLSPLLSKKGKSIIPNLSWLGLAVVFALIIRNWDVRGNAFAGMLTIDGFSNFFSLIFIVSSILIIFTSISYLKKEEILKGEYFALIVFATLGMMLMAGGIDLIIIFLGLA